MRFPRRSSHSVLRSIAVSLETPSPTPSPCALPAPRVEIEDRLRVRLINETPHAWQLLYRRPPAEIPLQSSIARVARFVLLPASQFAPTMHPRCRLGTN